MTKHVNIRLKRQYTTEYDNIRQNTTIWDIIRHTIRHYTSLSNTI